MPKFALMFGCFVVAAVQICFGADALDDKKPTIGVDLFDPQEAKEAWEAAGWPKAALPRRGMLVLDILPGSGAEAGGMRPLDLIVKVGRRPIVGRSQWEAAMDELQVGDTETIEIKRFNGRAWFPTKGPVEIRSLRETFYSALDIDYSSVSERIIAEHRSLAGRITTLSPTILAKDGQASLALTIRYQGSDWLFIEGVTLVGKTGKARLDIPLLSRSTDVAAGDDVAEWKTMAMTPEFEKILREPYSPSLEMRLDGQQKYIEDKATREWHARMQTVLAVYDDIKATDTSYLESFAR